jgi:hypothetical protein
MNEIKIKNEKMHWKQIGSEIHIIKKLIKI